MKEIDWDKVVTDVEEKWKNDKWKEFGAQSAQEYGLQVCDKPLSEESEEILDEISAENDRIDPDGAGTVDHEEVWRATGTYYIIRRKSDGNEGEKDR